MPRRTHRITTGHVAVLIATGALFVALDGPTHAAKAISGAQIKNNSVASKDIKNDTIKSGDVKDDALTGEDVLESSLGKVASAAAADSAATAATVPDNAITGAKVADGSLRAKDIAAFQAQVTVDLPNVPANDCAYSLVPVAAQMAGVPVFVSAGETGQFANGGLSIHVAKSNVQTSIRLVACNVTAGDINPVPAAFDFLAFAV